MTKDGKRTARLHSEDAIKYVEQYAEEHGMRIYEAVEDIVRKYRDGKTADRRDENVVITASAKGNDCFALIDVMLQRGHSIAAKKINEETVRVVVSK